MRHAEFIRPEPTPLASLVQNTQVAKSLELTIMSTKSQSAKLAAISMKNPMLIAPLSPRILTAGSMYFDANKAPAVYPVNITPTSK